MTGSDEQLRRKQLGAWYTPPELVDQVADAAVAVVRRCRGSGPVTVVDPACGDGRLLAAVDQRLSSDGIDCELTGVDLAPEAIDAATAVVPRARLIHADALDLSWSTHRPSGGFDLVIGNPPFRSQMAAITSRGGSSSRGGGPYADTAVEFLALAAELVAPDGGCVALVLPQSVLASRDAAAVRARIDATARIDWGWWSAEQQFDASVLTCALAFEFGPPKRGAAARRSTESDWSHVVTDRLGIPPLPAVLSREPDGEADGAGTLADRAWLNANFRDEYYGMVGAVGDQPDGPPLVTSGLIDPGVNHWGRRPVRFAKQRFEAPRIRLDVLSPKMSRWAQRRLVPKVLVANQTTIIEALCDPTGELLPGVPVTSVYPAGPTSTEQAELAWECAALLTSAAASAWVWHRSGGTGLSARSVRIGPVMLGELPWPTGSLSDAVTALRAGDLPECSRQVGLAYEAGAESDVESSEWVPLEAWWNIQLERVLRSAKRR